MKKLLSALLALILAAGCLPTALAEAKSANPDATSGATYGANADAALSDGADDALSGGEATDEDGLISEDGGNFNVDDGEAQPETPNVAATRAADGTVSFDGQFSIFCPTALASQQVDQQDLQDGLLFSAYSDTMGIDIYKYPQGEDTLQTLYDSYKADGDMTEVTLASVGDVQVLVYRIDETGIDVTLAGSTGSLYDIMITYQTNDEYQQVGQMIGSIKKIVG